MPVDDDVFRTTVQVLLRMIIESKVKLAALEAVSQASPELLAEAHAAALAQFAPALKLLDEMPGDFASILEAFPPTSGAVQ